MPSSSSTQPLGSLHHNSGGLPFECLSGVDCRRHNLDYLKINQPPSSLILLLIVASQISDDDIGIDSEH